MRYQWSKLRLTMPGDSFGDWWWFWHRSIIIFAADVLLCRWEDEPTVKRGFLGQGVVRRRNNRAFCWPAGDHLTHRSSYHSTSGDLQVDRSRHVLAPTASWLHSQVAQKRLRRSLLLHPTRSSMVHGGVTSWSQLPTHAVGVGSMSRDSTRSISRDSSWSTTDRSYPGLCS